MDVTLLYVDGCPHWQTADARLRVLADEFGLHVTYRRGLLPGGGRGVGVPWISYGAP